MTDFPVWGIDLTATSIRAIKLALDDDGKVRAEAWEVIDFGEDVADVHSPGRYDPQKRALHKFVRNHDLKECQVFVSLRGEAAFNRTVVVPQTADQNVDKLLEYEAQQQIPHPLEDVYWDRRVVAIKENGDVVATLYAVPRSSVTERLAKLEVGGLKVDGIVLRPIALQNFCARERLLEPGSVVIDVDYGGTQILLIHEDQPTFRSLPLGASEVVHRIAKDLGVDHRAAFKLAAGTDRPSEQQAGRVQAIRKDVAREIAAEVVQVIRGFGPGRGGFRPSNVVLFETHATVPPLADVLKAELAMPVFKAKGFHSIEIDPGIVSAGIQENFAGLARAAGLALQGLGKADVALRLYPDEMPRTFQPKPWGWLAAASLIVGLVALAGWQRDELAGDLKAATETGATLLREISARSPEALAREIAEDPLDAVRKTWERRARDRTGRLAWYDGLVREIEARRARGESPLLVHFAWGDVPGRAPAPDRGRVVIAMPEDRPVEEIDAAIGALMTGLAGKDALVSATPGPAWSAGALAAEPPAMPDTRALRHRFRHAAFDLLWETP
jgi:type IV pilus assembly protein PilM